MLRIFKIVAVFRDFVWFYFGNNIKILIMVYTKSLLFQSGHHGVLFIAYLYLEFYELFINRGWKN
jgi:hypothetical protein